MKKLILGICLIAANTVFGQSAMGEVIGTVVNKSDGQIIYGAQVFIVDQDKKYQVSTNAEGRFRISAIPAGEYLMNIKYYSDTMSGIKVKVTMDGIYNAGIIQFKSGFLEMPAINVSATGRIKLEYGSLPVTEITYKEIAHSPSKFSIKDMVIGVSSEVRMSDDGELMFRGSRKGDMIYMMDGIKSNEVSNVPSCAIGRMMVYTGGLPAKYGDTLGGAIVMETKSYFDLYRAWEADNLRSGN